VKKLTIARSCWVGKEYTVLLTHVSLRRALSLHCGFCLTRLCLILTAQREAWQNLGAILASKATVASFCLELSKKLDMRYQSPPLPVDLAVVRRDNNGTNVENRSTANSWVAGDDTSALKDLVALYDKNK
jgi:hypothetical protein